MTKFTPSQEKAILEQDKNLLVSAGAGSGKTTVMIARIVNLIEKHHIPISNFLVVTFTKASASDMKNKLIENLEKCEPNEFILNQIEEVGTSDVSNLHSFCARLLKTYFYKIGLDPSFIVLDELEMEALKTKALEQLFNECLENNDKEMLLLADILNKNRSENSLEEAIMELSKFLKSQPDSEKWFNDNLEKCYSTDLNNNVCAAFINNKTIKMFKSFAAKFSAILSKIDKQTDEKLFNYVQNLVFIANLITETTSLETNFYNLINLPPFKTIPAKVDGEYEELKAQVLKCKNAFAEQIKNFKEMWGEETKEDIICHLEENKNRVLTLKRLASRYDEILSSLKNAKGGLDFDDLEHFAIKLLENKEVLDALKEKYKYIFVDEYQDISPLQEKIISTIAGPNNRFMVGDIKQSIYRFRLCEPEIFLDKYNSYKSNLNANNCVIDLKENFRSNYKILDFCNFVFSRCYTKAFGGIDYTSAGMLVCGTDKWENLDDEKTVSVYFNDTSTLKEESEDSSQEPLKVYSVLNADEEYEKEKTIAETEAKIVASSISKLYGQKINSAKGESEKRLRYKDFVVLMATRGTYLEQFTKTLKELGLPVASDYSEDVFEDPDILAVLNLLKIINNFADDYSLISVMVSRLFNFSYNDLAAIKIASGGEKYFYEAVQSVYKNASLENVLQHKLNEFFNTITTLRTKSKIISAKALMEEINDEFKLELLFLASEDRVVKAQRLSKFMQTFSDISLSAYLENLKNSSVICESVPEGDAIRVMTVHAAKGLEFPVVYLVNCGKDFSRKSGQGDLLISKDLGVGLKYYNQEDRFKCENFVRSAIKESEAFKIKEEQLRLLYVALTRAVNHLTIIASTNHEKFSEFKAAEDAHSFADWLAPVYFAKLQKNRLLTNIADVNLLNTNDDLKEVIKPEKKQVIFTNPNMQKVLELQKIYNNEENNTIYSFDAKSSVSKLIKDKDTIKSVVPAGGNNYGTSADEGTMYHKVLENATFKEKTIEDIDKLIEKLQNNGDIDKNYINNDGKQVLLKVINSPIIQNNYKNGCYKEKEFIMAYNPITKQCDNSGDFMVVQGVCDLVLKTKNGLILVDYKRTQKNAQQLLDSYGEQLYLYSLALEASYQEKVAQKYICNITTGEFIKVD